MANVLVVDADLLVLSMVADVLETEEHTVSKAQSGAEGLRLLRGPARFDLLIADVALENVSGVRLIQKARSEQPDLPVMAISAFNGHDTTRLRQSLRALGVAQLLRKPFAAQALQQAVIEALGKRR
jgi:CheY-like chemotaxis protein